MNSLVLWARKVLTLLKHQLMCHSCACFKDNNVEINMFHGSPVHEESEKNSGYITDRTGVMCVISCALI